MKILYDLNSVQRLVDVESSGGVCGDASVLWNEGVDGTIRSDVLASLGGWVRQGSQLVVDNVKLAAAQAARQTLETQRAARANRIALAKTFLKNLDTSSTLSTAVLTQSVRAIIVILQDLQSQLD